MKKSTWKNGDFEVKEAKPHSNTEEELEI